MEVQAPSVDLSIKHFLGIAPVTANFHIRRHFTIPEPTMKWQRFDEKDPSAGGEAVPILDENGLPVIDDVMYVEYMSQRRGANNFCEARVKDLLSINHALPDDDPGKQVAIARAKIVVAYFERIQGGNKVVQQGTTPLDAWGAVIRYKPLLMHYGFETVDQIAEMTEADAARLPGGIQPLRLRDEAKAFLYSNQAAALNAAGSARDEKISEMERKLAEREKQLDELREMVHRLANTKLAEAGVKPDAAAAPGQSNTARTATRAA